VYGGYEASLKQVDAYFAMMRQAPHFTASTGTGEQFELNADLV